MDFVTIQIKIFLVVGLNEAAVQLMASKALNLPYDNVKYFDISFRSNTPNYYPLECALVMQMAYAIGEDVLFDSTLNSTNNFKEKYISITSKRDFFKIERNIDLLVDLQATLSSLYSELDNSEIDEEAASKISKNISFKKLQIKRLFMNTQKLIITSYFDNIINLAYIPKTLENYRNKLYLFKNFVGSVAGDTFYNDYYIDKMMELEKRYEYHPVTTTDLTVIKPSLISKLISKLKLLFGLNKQFERV